MPIDITGFGWSVPYEPIFHPETVSIVSYAEPPELRGNPYKWRSWGTGMIHSIALLVNRRNV